MEDRTVSLNAVNEIFKRWIKIADFCHEDTDTLRNTLQEINELPPVTPQQKTGHWIFDDECKEHGHCSRCGYGRVDLVDGEPHNYCPNCGAKMVEPQESEDKE